MSRGGWVKASCVALVVIGAVAWYAWTNRTGCFSHRNYERIENGMSRDQVAELLGSHGEETKAIPHHPPYVHHPGAPPGWTGVVWGDTFVNWRDGVRDIYVGFFKGRVTSKYYWEPSF